MVVKAYWASRLPGVGMALPWGAIALAAMLTVGCALRPDGGHAVAPYPEDQEPIVALQRLGTTTVGVDRFLLAEGAELDFSCGEPGTIAFPGEQSPTAYVRAALVRELRRAGVYERLDHEEPWKNADIALSGSLHRFELDLERGMWLTGLRMTSTRGGETFVTDIYRFDVGEEPAAACRNAAAVVAPAVRRMLELLAPPGSGAQGDAMSLW